MSSGMISRKALVWSAQDPVISWLIDRSEPAMRYLVSRDILEPRPGERALERLRTAIPNEGWTAKILAGQRNKTWWITKKTCYRPKFRSTIWRLQVLADLGISRRDERISNAVEFFLDLHLARDGGYSPIAKQARKAPTTGHLCTTGNMIRSLIRFGYFTDDRVQSAIDWLVRAQLQDGGWDCFGRKNGTLDAWEAMSAFAEIPEGRRSLRVRRAIQTGAEFFLKRRLLHEGRPFPRWYSLRYPWHYFYDVLVGLDFVSALGYGKDPRAREAIHHLVSLRRPDGKWNLNHTNGNLSLEDAGQPSKMITFLSLRAIKRLARS